MTYYIQAILLTWVEALSCGIFCDTFLEKKCIIRGRICHISLPLLFLGFIGISLLSGITYFTKAIFAVTWIALVAAIQYRNNLLKIIFVSAGYYGLVLCLDRIMIILIDYASFIGAAELFKEPIKGTVIALLCKSVLFLIIILLNKKFKAFGSLNLIEDKEWMRFLLFPIMTIACMTILAMEGGSDGGVLAVAFVLVFSNFLMFYIIRDIIAKEAGIRAVQVSKERTKNQMDMYRYMERVYEEQRKKVHEFKNQIDCLEGLLKGRNYKEVEQYMSKLTNSWTEETDYINTNHAVVNSILNQKYKQAKSLGIPILFFINDLGEVPIGDEDIVILIANLLDNAIEACQKLTEEENVIKFRFLKEGDKITISIRNKVKGTVKMIDGRLETTKIDYQEHGIGMTNIQSVVEKYGGENIWSCREGYFTQSIIFYL